MEHTVELCTDEECVICNARSIRAARYDIRNAQYDLNTGVYREISETHHIPQSRVEAIARRATLYDAYDEAWQGFISSQGEEKQRFDQISTGIYKELLASWGC